MAICQELLDILVCPQCRGELVLTPGQDGLVCGKCRLLYEIREDIPIMLIEEAKPVE
ncbi:MAG: Trm112 family protein [Pseudomonadota bacterium]